MSPLILDGASFLAFAVLVSRIGDVDVPLTGAVMGVGGYRAVLRDRLFVRLWVLVLLLVVAGYAQMHAAFPVYVTGVGGLSAGGLGAAFAANTITVVLAQLVVLRLMTGRRRTRG